MSGADRSHGARVDRTLRAVRIPLAGLLDHVELLLEGDLSPADQRQARMIYDSGRSMLALIDDLLDTGNCNDFSSVAANAIDIGLRVHACADAMRREAERKGLVLRCETDPDLPTLADCDPTRFRQVVVSLLASAIESTASGWVSICAEPAWNDPGTVAISVTDTGHGATAEGDLALTICHELALLMGGTLTRSSEPGRGSRAELRLPVSPRSASGPGSTVSIARERRRDAPRVLVVDSHEVRQSLAIDQLERIGARAISVAYGRAALSIVADAEAVGDPVRLVLMELEMPSMDGFATTRILRAGGRDGGSLPVLAMTADVGACDIPACLAAGMQGHLATPIDLDSLRYAVDRWVPEEEDVSEKVFDRRRWPHGIATR